MGKHRRRAAAWCPPDGRILGNSSLGLCPPDHQCLPTSHYCLSPSQLLHSWGSPGTVLLETPHLFKHSQNASPHNHADKRTLNTEAALTSTATPHLNLQAPRKAKRHGSVKLLTSKFPKSGGGNSLKFISSPI